MNDFIVAEIFLSESKLPIDRFAGAQKFARLEAHLLNQFSQLFLAERLEVIVNLAEINAAFSEEPVHLAAFRAGWFFVDGDVVVHLIWSAATCHRFVPFCDSTHQRKAATSRRTPNITGICRAPSSLQPRDRWPGYM